jgi:hypothetical protein
MPRIRTMNEVDPDRLQAWQDEALGLTSHRPISRFKEADQFLSKVGIALRYGPTQGLPIASLYRAFAGPEPGKEALAQCIAITNRLLGEARAVEVHVIAGRVTLVHRFLMPALYALVRRGRALGDLEGLSANARTAMALFAEKKEITAGDLRQRLGMPFDVKRDPSYTALGELSRYLLVDRGPFEMPKAGIPYLSTEGYPYHLFHESHADLVEAASRYSVASAAEEFLAAYLRGAVFARFRKLATLFKAFLSPDEIEGALQNLAKAKGKIEVRESGRDRIILACKGLK